MHKFRLSPVVVERGFVHGWALVAGTRHATVQLYLDGRPAARELTGAPLPKAVVDRCGKPPRPDAGFAIALPPEALDGFKHNLHVALVLEGEDDIHGQVLSYRSAAVRGEVRQQGRLFVGSAWFDKIPPKPAVLSVSRENGEVIHRQELTPGAVAQAHGFPASFQVEREEWPVELLHFTIRGQELRGSPCRRRSHPVGMVEAISVSGIRGWAFDAADPKQPIELLIRVDGRDVAWFRPNVRRADIARKIGYAEEGWGLVGFEVNTPDELRDGEPHSVEIVVTDGGQLLSKGQQTVRLPAVGTRWTDVGIERDDPVPAFPLEAYRAAGPRAPVVSVVVLTRNGEALLEEFLKSWAVHMTSVPAEIIVVDHASSDGTRALLRRWQKRLALKVIALDHNGSFSDSCNLGAQQAKGEYLLFANNDIVWLQDSLPRLIEALQDPGVGIVGLKLLKIVGESSTGGRRAKEVQHLGVRFKLNDRGYWPYETSPSERNRETEYAAQAVPAVTGAVLMCRRSDFDAVGGFDSDYFYGFEDVELCLRLAYRLRKAVVCRNDSVALHHHGHTRLSGRELSIFDRLMRNSAVLQRHIGVWVKQAYWRSLLLGDGYITSEPLSIGIVAESDRANAATRLARAAHELARQLVAVLPHAEIVLLDPAHDWKNVAGLHVLVSGDPRYDVRTLKGARADLLTIAWPQGDLAQWKQLPWWDHFGLRLVPRPAARAGAHPLAEALSTSRWRMRVAIHARPAHDAQARVLRKALQRDGLVCWVVEEADFETHPLMADVCITLWASQPPSTMPASLRTDVLNVLWITDGGKVKTPTGDCLVTTTAPGAAWLEGEMEKRVGSTFSPS